MNKSNNGLSIEWFKNKSRGVIGSYALHLPNSNDIDLLFHISDLSEIEHMLKSYDIVYDLNDKYSGCNKLGNSKNLKVNIDGVDLDLIFYEDVNDIDKLNEIIKMMNDMPTYIRSKFTKKQYRISIFENLVRVALDIDSLI